MSKNRSPISNEIAITTVLVLGFILILVLNILTLVPGLVEVFQAKPVTGSKGPIDEQTVTEAIKLLKPE